MDTTPAEIAWSLAVLFLYIILVLDSIALFQEKVPGSHPFELVSKFFMRCIVFTLIMIPLAQIMTLMGDSSSAVIVVSVMNIISISSILYANHLALQQIYAKRKEYEAKKLT